MPLSTAEIVSLSRLLDEALALSPADRDAWFAALPPADQPHAARLREMLAAQVEPGTDGPLSTLPKLGPDDSLARAGERVGPYRLIREIGHGGMGSVWLAERADGSFKREVALKLPRLAWDAGLAERMAREREIGMLLEHPAIARLYDAGLDERGRPYLALEYIDGQPLDTWCEAQALDVRGRLKLFVQVVRAVAYAHGRLIVHRDLKPSNVLVSADGQAHLLDFGIAKLLTDAGAADGPGLTQQQGRVMTPHYASPEQVAGEAITVASDIYSLGVLLYEVLTGVLPIAPKRSTAAAVEDAVLQGDAPLASSRVKDRAVAKVLRGEIDAILAKAMQREPGRRYATADALAQDIERHLNGETVTARPDSLVYRLRKAIRRNWIAVSAATAVLLAVISGSGVAVVQAKRANDAADRARVVKEFIVDVFKVNERSNGGNLKLRQLPAELLLERGAGLIASKFPGQPSLQAELYGVVSGIFADMGGARLAAEYARKHINALDVATADDTEKARATLILAASLAEQDRLSDAALQAERALRLAAGDFLLTLRSRLLRVRISTAQSRYNEAGIELDRLEHDLKAVPSPLPPELTVMAVEALWYRATLRTQNRKGLELGSLAALWDQAIAAALTAQGPQSRLAATIRLDFAYLLAGENGGRAREELTRALSTMRELGGPEDIGAAVAQSRVYAMLYEWSNVTFDEAVAAITESQRILSSLGSKVPSSIRASVDFNLGWVYRTWGDVEKAYSLQSSAAQELRELAESPFALRVIETSVGMDASEVGHHDEADALLHRALELRKRDSARNPVNMAYGYAFIVGNLLMQGRVDEAERQLEAAPGTTAYTAMYRAEIALARSDPRQALSLLSGSDLSVDKSFDLAPVQGAALCDVGDPIKGLAMLDAYVRRRSADRYVHAPNTARVRAVAGLCALAAGKRALALEYAAAARRAFDAQPGVSAYYKAPLDRLERALKKHFISNTPTVGALAH